VPKTLPCFQQEFSLHGYAVIPCARQNSSWTVAQVAASAFLVNITNNRKGHIMKPYDNPQADTSKKDIQQLVTDSIIRQLEAGTIPWQKPWKDNGASYLGLPKNAVTGKSYNGINIILLWGSSIEKQYASNDWASFKQWQSKNESVRKGEKGNFIVYADSFEKEVDDEIKKIPFLKYSAVFNRCQLASYKPENIDQDNDAKTLVERIATVDDFIGNTLAVIEHKEGGAYYDTVNDKIVMPSETSFLETKQCRATENYYSTLLHELTHWTGHAKRLNRKIKNKFGDDAYAEEELIAELGAAFLSAGFGITTPEKTDHASYIAHWLKILKGNKQFIISAASEASKAVSYMKELQPLKIVY
jgi:antirestriction protein ArdC